MRHKRNPEVDQYIERVQSIPKQNAHLNFDLPAMPDFMAVEVEETDTLDDSELTDTPTPTDKDQGATAPESVKIQRENPANNVSHTLEYYAQGRIMIVDFLARWLLGLINGESPDRFKLDPNEEALLVEAQARVMEAEGLEYSPKRMRNEAFAIVYIPKLKGLFPRLSQLGGWIKKQFSKRAEARKAKQAQRQENQKEAEALRVLEEGAKKQAEYFEAQQNQLDQRERKLAEQAEQLAEQLAKLEKLDSTKKAKTQKVKAGDRKPTIDTSNLKAPSLSDVQTELENNRCIMPSCNTDKGKNKMFCSGSHRSAYVEATKREKDPFPTITQILNSKRDD